LPRARPPIADHYAARFEAGFVEADPEALDYTRLDILGAAARARVGQIAAEPGNTAESFPFAAVPPISAADLAARLEAD